MQYLQPNTLLQGGKYRIERVLGQGSFGITYQVVHMVLNKRMAIKEFFMGELNSRMEDGSVTGITDGSLTSNYKIKFRKEAQNLATMNHPNIVRITDSFDENSTCYYVMDYIEGQNLNDYVKSNTVSQEEAIAIINKVADALIYMHEEKHMLHLDLKPGNIMRRACDGHIFLIDFGLSKHFGSDGQPETSTTIGLGTSGYAPIEQGVRSKNGEFRPTIDVYSLGATFFKLLTGETPPVASDIVSDDGIIEEKMEVHGITGPLKDIIIKAMMPSVRKRTETIRKFKQELELIGLLASADNCYAKSISDDDCINENAGIEETKFFSEDKANNDNRIDPFYARNSSQNDSQEASSPNTKDENVLRKEAEESFDKDMITILHHAGFFNEKSKRQSKIRWVSWIISTIIAFIALGFVPEAIETQKEQLLLSILLGTLGIPIGHIIMMFVDKPRYKEAMNMIKEDYINNYIKK